MNPIKINQKIKIIPDKIEKFSMGIIISVSEDCFVAKVNNPDLIMPDSESEILISFDEYTVIFISKIIKAEGDNVTFSVPSKFNFIQKREYHRINTKIPVFFKEIEEINKEIEAEIINIGGGGMKVASFLNSKHILNARFNLPNKKEIKTLFEILRVVEENKKFFLSGKFKIISNFDKTAIIQFCFKRQLEAKYKK